MNSIKLFHAKILNCIHVTKGRVLAMLNSKSNCYSALYSFPHWEQSCQWKLTLHFDCFKLLSVKQEWLVRSAWAFKTHLFLNLLYKTNISSNKQFRLPPFYWFKFTSIKDFYRSSVICLSVLKIHWFYTQGQFYFPHFHVIGLGMVLGATVGSTTQQSKNTETAYIDPILFFSY